MVDRTFVVPEVVVTPQPPSELAGHPISDPSPEVDLGIPGTIRSARRTVLEWGVVLVGALALPALCGLIALQVFGPAPDQSQRASLGSAGAQQGDDRFPFTCLCRSQGADQGQGDFSLPQVVSDGLAKTSDQDWIHRYVSKAGQPQDKSNDIVIVQMGANDITTIRNGRTRESFNTDVWNALYQQRVVTLARTLEANSAKLYWVGLPVVGNTSWEPSYRIISQLQSAAVRKAGGTFVDIHELTTFGTGDFSMNGNFEGRLMQLRAADKVHFTKPGYDYVASVVLADLGKVIENHNRRIALQDVQLQ